MKPAILNFTVYQGSTLNKNFQWLAGTTPVNLSGCQIRMQMAYDYKSTSQIEFSTQNGAIVLTDAVLGKFDLKILPAVSQAMIYDRYVYDIEVVFPNTDVFRIIQGQITIDKEVTK